MTFDPNDLYTQMIRYYADHKDDPDKVIFCNEGSSRSSKTWDFIHFVVTYCDHNRRKNKDIYFLRDTLIHCRDFTLKEVEKCFRAIGIPFQPVYYPKPYINLWGNNIYFRGLDDEMSMEGFPSHISFVNEALDIPTYEHIAGILMRCEDVFAMDWNPKFTDHWAFDFERRPNCLFTHSTFRNNKHLPESVRREIESYDPGNPVNITNGTADDYRWKVYGLGIRAALQGLVFPDITWIDEFPADVERVYYGLDFGYTNSPTALPKVGISGRNLYIQNLIYTPINNPDDLAAAIRSLGITERIWADTADPGSILHLYQYGLPVYGAKKWPGCINYGISIMKGFKIHCVKNPDMAKEANNYKWREINGIPLNEPVDAFNHIWDAVRYVVLMEVAGRE